MEVSFQVPVVHLIFADPWSRTWGQPHYTEGNYTEPIAQWGQGGSTMVAGPVAVAAGRYYVRVYTAGGSNTDQLYNLVVTLP